MAVITIFGSSGTLPGAYEYDSAELGGKLLSEKGFDLCDGGYAGVMEAAFKGAADSEVKRIAVIAEEYPDKKPNEYATEVIVEKTYVDRMQKMIALGDAYIVFPGGSGTLLELAAVWTFKNRGFIGDKPIVCIGEQWHEVLQTMGFYSEKALDNLRRIDNAETVEKAVDIVASKLK